MLKQNLVNEKQSFRQSKKKHLYKFVDQDQKAYQEDNSETFFLYT